MVVLFDSFVNSCREKVIETGEEGEERWRIPASAKAAAEEIEARGGNEKGFRKGPEASTGS